MISKSHHGNRKRLTSPPADETSSSSQIGKVVEDLPGTGLNGHVGKRAKEGTKADSDVRQPTARGASKDLGRLTVDGKTVEGTTGCKEIGGSGGPRRGQETSIDDGWESGDTGIANGNDKGRSEGVTAVELESGAVGRDENTNDKGTAEVKEENTDVDSLDCAREVAAGVLGFTRGDGDDLGTDVGD